MAPVLLLAASLLGCGERSATPPPPSGELVFLRDAVISPVAEGPGQALASGGRLVSLDWQPGQPVELDGLSATAPRRAECLPLFSAELGDVSRLVAMGGAAPDTALAFSPDGSKLAVGSYRGEVLVLDAWTGELLARRSLAETMVKQVAWAPDGGTLYAAEQSPDAFLRALDPASLDDRWSLRLADHVDPSAPPEGEDVYGVYSLPAAFGLEVLADGTLVVVAAHSWLAGDGVRKNRSQVLLLQPDGRVQARWPQRPADANLLHPRVDASGQALVVAVSRSADGPAPADLPVGGVQVLSLPELQPGAAVHTAPLEPWFKEAMVWEALDVSTARDALLLGLGDGRLRILGLDGRSRVEDDGGAPVMAGEVPIHVAIGWGLLHDDSAVVATSSTLIPWGAAAPDLRPPTTHPGENTVRVLGLDGQARWRWTGEHELQGLSLAPQRGELIVGAGRRAADQRSDLFGALVFDLDRATGTGAERLVAECPTAGPIFFRHAVAPDGRIAVAEVPTLDPDGAVQGAYRVTVLR